LRQLGVTLKAGRVVTTGTCHAPLPIQAGDFFLRLISVCWERCRWDSRKLSRHCEERQRRRNPESRVRLWIASLRSQ